MAFQTRHRRLGVLASKGLRSAVIVAAALWLNRRLDRRHAEPGRDGLATAVEDLTVAYDRLADTVDRRLRSLEESAARAEAEVRFMATLLGEQDGARRKKRARTGAADRAQRPRHTSDRAGHLGSGHSAAGAAEGAMA